MHKYKSFEKLFCDELCDEVSKYEHEKTFERAKKVKTILEIMFYMEMLKGADAMKEYFGSENNKWNGYNNADHLNIGRMIPPIYPTTSPIHRMMYNMVNPSTYMEYPQTQNDYPMWENMADYDYGMDWDGIMNETRRRRDSRGRFMSDGMSGDIENRSNGGNGSRGGGSRSGGNRGGNSRGGSYRNDGGGTYNDGGSYNGGYGGIYNHGDMKEAYRKRKLTKAEYKEWMEKMQHADGGSGEMWSMEETTAVGKKVGIDFEKHDKMVFCVAMNMMYSDYCEVAEKFNVNTPEFYACMAKAFLDDEDSIKWGDKLSAYYNAVVED